MQPRVVVWANFHGEGLDETYLIAGVSKRLGEVLLELFKLDLGNQLLRD